MSELLNAAVGAVYERNRAAMDKPMCPAGEAPDVVRRLALGVDVGDGITADDLSRAVDIHTTLALASQLHCEPHQINVLVGLNTAVGTMAGLIKASWLDGYMTRSRVPATPEAGEGDA